MRSWAQPILISVLFLLPVSGAFAQASSGGTVGGSSGVFIRVVKRDPRMCIAPVCGGYWVRVLNNGADEYVASIDQTSLDAVTLRQMQGAADGELVLLGSFGPVDPQFGVRSFSARSAYRGMPGVVPSDSDSFYTAKDVDPAVTCVVAPCPNEIATLLNQTQQFLFDTFSVVRASKPWVDQGWLTQRVRHEGAVVAAQLVNGQSYPGGYERILDSSQVFIALPYSDGPCLLPPVAYCQPPSVNVFTRNDDRCVIPDGCAVPGACPTFMPACSAGYSLQSWRSQPGACPAYACDPTFVLRKPTVSPSALTFSAITSSSLTVQWLPGDGDAVAVFMATAPSSTAVPEDGAAYVANATFGGGSQIGASGWYSVYQGSANSVTVTGLTAGTTYQVMALSLNGAATGSPTYLTTAPSDNPSTVTTVSTGASSSVPAAAPWSLGALALALLLAARRQLRRATP